MLLILKAEAAKQLALFAAPAAVHGYVRAGVFVAPHVATRHKRPEEKSWGVPGLSLAPITFEHAAVTDNPGYLSAEQFIQERAYRHAIKDTYFGDGRHLSSRVVPQREVRIPLGAWRIDDMNGLHGHEIAQLREVNLDELILPELDDKGHVTPNKRDDVPLYAKWTQVGMEPPPIEVVQTDRGKLRVTDGHRRVVAAKLAGRNTLRAWVSPVTPVSPGLNDSEGRPLMTGLTWELAPKHPGATLFGRQAVKGPFGV